MTFTRIALAILAVPFAWRWGPALLSFLAGLLPLLGSLISFMTPNFGSTTIDQLFRFLISLVLFWFIFRGLGLAFGFLAPKAQQFATTKLLRRLQGVVAEVALLAAIFFVMVGLLAAVWIPAKSTPSGRARAEEAERYKQQRQEFENRLRKEEKKQEGESLVDIYKKEGEWKLERDGAPTAPKEPKH